MKHAKHTFLYIVDPMLVFEFIHRIIDILTDYLGDVSESSIRENFVTVYQVRLLDINIYKKPDEADDIIFFSYWKKCWIMDIL